ncbi:hypothetical protein K7X08_002238 [Anisodus acutangulus]|uniref:Uncharacterized protein n=1 Tax=Anisodus acutangulus TaxID=402998 RepID=A0A9Q1LSK1_9SOLA|nr:hypothetical protein K7X08_002238 [Anisodus acutangulus]
MAQLLVLISCATQFGRLLGDARKEGYMAIIKSTWQLNIKYSAALMYMLASVVGIKKKSLSQQMILNIQQSMAGKWEPFMIASLLMIYTTETKLVNSFKAEHGTLLRWQTIIQVLKFTVTLCAVVE